MATYGSVPIRVATVALFIAAAAVAVGVRVPVDLPVVALGQAAVYRLEILLALFYGGLLLLTPLFHGALHGRLPIEISHRGAKWPADAEKALKESEERLRWFEEALGFLKSKHFEYEER